MIDDLTPGPAPTPSQAQCSVCKQTFSGVTLFDRHRKGGECADPRSMTGLRQDGKSVWRGPEGGTPWYDRGPRP